MVAGCGAAPSGGGSSGDGAVGSATIDEKLPFVGSLREFGSAKQEEGQFVLAYCGCTCWRALITRADGTLRRQVLVHFKPESAEDAASTLIMEGEAEAALVTGVVDQNAGVTDGRALIGPYAMIFEADRNQEAISQTDTCVMCHFGEQPVWTLPSYHPDYELEPPNCLGCHPLGN